MHYEHGWIKERESGKPTGSALLNGGSEVSVDHWLSSPIVMFFPLSTYIVSILVIMKLSLLSRLGSPQSLTKINGNFLMKEKKENGIRVLKKNYRKFM